jgi:transposase-like protein
MQVGVVAGNMRKISYAGYRFAPEVLNQAIWLYLRSTLSFRDVEDLLAERGIAVPYETVRPWVNHFGPTIAAQLRKCRPKPHATWHLDEVYLKIGAGWSIYGAPSTPRARFSMCWSSPSATSLPLSN